MLDVFVFLTHAQPQCDPKLQGRCSGVDAWGARSTRFQAEALPKAHDTSLVGQSLVVADRSSLLPLPFLGFSPIGSMNAFERQHYWKRSLRAEPRSTNNAMNTPKRTPRPFLVSALERGALPVGQHPRERGFG